MIFVFVNDLREIGVRLLRYSLENRNIIITLLILCAIDLFFIISYLIISLQPEFKTLIGPWASRQFDLGKDQKFAEIFNYIQILALVVFLFRIFAMVRQPVYFTWALVFLIVLFDDSLKGHENLGAYFSGMVGQMTLFGVELQEARGAGGLRTQDVGELIAFGLIGVCIVVIMAIGFFRSNREHKIIGLIFAVLLCLLAFFAVVVDFVHRLFPMNSTLFTAVEDGGEMLTISLTVTVALTVYRYYETLDSH